MGDLKHRVRHPAHRLFGAAAGAFLSAAILAAGPEPSFRNEVMAVLSRGGCNQGVCHGNRQGKGGFKLSLRGEDPDRDLQTLARDLFARRINPLEPDQSLLLLKPTLAVPHEGGRRFPTGAPELDVLRRWVAAGLPADPPGAPRLVRLEVDPAEHVLIEPEEEIQIRAHAEFSDGSRRDVTGLSVFEPISPLVTVSLEGRIRWAGLGETVVLVRYLSEQTPMRLARARAGAPPGEQPAPANYVDEIIGKRLRALRIRPSAPGSDTSFLRRAYLDLLGFYPTADEARAFLSDPRPDRRERLVDALLERPEFAEFWALKWADLLRIEERSLDRKGVEAFYQWIRSAIADGKPLDRFASELLASRGSTYTEPAANYYRAVRDPLARAEAAAQVFLGTRLQCARCHNHPFDRWTQDDYYGWAAFFSRVRYKVLENRRRDKNDGHEFIGEQVVWMSRDGEQENARTGKPAEPRFLGDPLRRLDAGDDRLLSLAAWVAGQNPLFARVQANRIWFNLLGRGIVDPPDDFRATNPPSHPELLEALTRDLVSHGYDLRHLIRVIMASRTYQLSSEPNETNREDEASFSRGFVRRLTAEQLLDSQARVLGVPFGFNGYPAGLRAAQIPGIEAVRARDQGQAGGDQLLQVFGKPPRLLSCECERSGETSMNQAFQLVSGRALHGLLTHPQGRLAGLAASATPLASSLEELYWTALSRPPAEDELRAALVLLEKAPDRRQGLEDLAWGLLNSKEFVLRF